MSVSAARSLLWSVLRMETVKNNPFKVGDVIEDVELSFPLEVSETKIRIKKARVVRFDKGRSKARTCCGLEFIEVKQSQVKALTDFIYMYQRKYLRRRIRPDI